MKVVFSWNRKGDRAHILRLLQAEKVVIGDSDTVFGFLVQATQQGRDLLDRIKKRSDKPYLVLVGSIEKALDYFNPSIQAAIKKVGHQFWPGPLTIIAQAGSEVPAYLAPEGKIAIRVPQHEGLQEVLSVVPALFSTSANVSGEPIPAAIDKIDPDFIAQTSAVIHDKYHRQKEPSTIIELGENQVHIVRPGIHSLQALQKVLAKE